MGRAHTMHVPYEEFMTPCFFYPLPQSPDMDGETWAFSFFPMLFAATISWHAPLAFITKRQRLFTNEDIEGPGMPNTFPHHIRDLGLSRQELSLNFYRSSAMDAGFH